MQPKHTELVQASWQKVLPIAEQFAETFYGKLFALDPKLNPLFTTDMDKQGRKLISALHVLVLTLGNFDAFTVQVRTISQRHRAYGVTNSDYATFGEALLWTLEQGLDEDFSLEVELAWRKAYDLVTEVMRTTAERAA